MPNIKLDDLEIILTLGDAWKFTLKNISMSLDLDYILKVNGCVSRNESLDWGMLRYGNVVVDGTDYLAEIGRKVNDII